jgi:hypothetical protein
MSWSSLQRCVTCGAVLVFLCICFCASAIASGDANHDACPNQGLPGFRSYLPDCRAYEAVTPPDKAGYNVQGLVISEDGNQILGASGGGFAGVAADVFDSPYRFARTNENWLVSPLLSEAAQVPLLPSHQLVTSVFDAASASLSDSLWDVFYRPEAFPMNLEDVIYLHKPDGSFVAVGPRWPGMVVGGESRFRGASRDLSTIVFSNGTNTGELWPGDSTKEAESIYEYVGTNNSEPKLVSVKNQKALINNDEAELISQCGTALGGKVNGDKYNAVSSDGKIIYFTAENDFGTCSAPAAGDEIYARVDGTKTVSISEPTLADCEVCNTTSGLEKGIYQGASEDGSKVFFMTSQELLPGVTGSNLYEYDFNNPQSSPQDPTGKIVLVSQGTGEANVRGVARVSEDGSRVYFVAGGKLTGSNREGKEPAEGENNLYVFQRDVSFPKGKLSFVAQMSPADTVDWERRDFKRPFQATPNGEFAAFLSSAQLTPDDTSNVAQLFEYDAGTERLARLSEGQKSRQSPGGFNENGNTSNEFDAVTIPSPQFLNSDNPVETTNSLNISTDGTRVFFQSSLALAPQALNNYVVARVCPGLLEEVCVKIEQEFGVSVFQSIYAQNVYEYRWDGADFGTGNVYLISGGQDISSFQLGEAVHLLGTTPSGRDVFFTTASSLVPSDTTAQVDIYDAREGGGFEASASTSGCSVGGCQGLLDEARSVLAPGSSAQAGGDNIKPAATQTRTISKDRKKSRTPTKKKKKEKHKKGKARKARLHKNGKRSNTTKGSSRGRGQ